MATPAKAKPITELLDFPLFEAMLGRRARRFGLGMEIPSGPLAYKSKHESQALSELEESILIAAATGVTGWNFGVPFGPGQPEEHGQFTVRYTGRSAPTAAGIGTPILLFTNDSGIYATNTRDVQPSRQQEFAGSEDDAERIMAVCRQHTVKLSNARLDLPAAPGHMLDANFWMANARGSTLFIPLADASEEMLGLLAMMIANGYVVMDDKEKRPAGNVERFVASGLFQQGKAFPLSVLEQTAYEANCAETAFMGHNIALALQAMGLGGLYFNGVNRWSVLGAFAGNGVKGLGARFVEDERWTLPNPVGIDGVYEALCPPYYPDMRAAARAFAERKFGPGGAYDPNTPGPWKDSRAVKGSVAPYSEEFVECLGEIAQYIYDKHGKFPGTFTTLVLTGYAQAHHLDTDFYDTHYQPGAYLRTHASHMEQWHGQGAG